MHIQGAETVNMLHLLLLVGPHHTLAHWDGAVRINVTHVEDTLMML
jgi:hypothetical protein